MNPAFVNNILHSILSYCNQSEEDLLLLYLSLQRWNPSSVFDHRCQPSTNARIAIYDGERRARALTVHIYHACVSEVQSVKTPYNKVATFIHFLH